jgi:hypothetical protein
VSFLGPGNVSPSIVARLNIPSSPRRPSHLTCTTRARRLANALKRRQALKRCRKPVK